MASGGLPQWRAERLLGLLTAGGRLRPERQPRELFADHPQLVLRAGFASERCPRASASSPVRASSCFFNSISELGPLLTRALAFVPGERSLRPRVGLFAPLRDKITSSAQSLVPLPVGPAKDRAYQS